jgi:hypothetical protein
MSLVDITPPPAEDDPMDPATKQYVDSSVALAEARNDVKLAEFRATIEAYTARAEEREAAAREREAVRVRDFARLEATLASIKRAIVTATLSSVMGIAALNAALYQGTLSMFDIGRQFGVTQADRQRHNDDTVFRSPANGDASGQPPDAHRKPSPQKK